MAFAAAVGLTVVGVAAVNPSAVVGAGAYIVFFFAVINVSKAAVRVGAVSDSAAKNASLVVIITAFVVCLIAAAVGTVSPSAAAGVVGVILAAFAAAFAAGI